MVQFGLEPVLSRQAATLSDIPTSPFIHIMFVIIKNYNLNSYTEEHEKSGKMG